MKNATARSTLYDLCKVNSQILSEQGCRNHGSVGLVALCTHNFMGVQWLPKGGANRCMKTLIYKTDFIEKENLCQSESTT